MLPVSEQKAVAMLPVSEKKTGATLPASYRPSVRAGELRPPARLRSPPPGPPVPCAQRLSPRSAGAYAGRPTKLTRAVARDRPWSFSLACHPSTSFVLPQTSAFGPQAGTSAAGTRQPPGGCFLELFPQAAGPPSLCRCATNCPKPLWAAALLPA